MSPTPGPGPTPNPDSAPEPGPHLTQARELDAGDCGVARLAGTRGIGRGASGNQQAIPRGRMIETRGWRRLNSAGFGTRWIPVLDGRSRPLWHAAASPMNDPWNPSWEEIRSWAFSSDPFPCQDWELACVWREGYFADYARLAASEDCPRRRFFLNLLYVAVGDRVRRGEPTWQLQSLIAKGDGVHHPDIRTWQERSRELLAMPETFEHFDWGGGGWSGYRTSLTSDDVWPPWMALDGSASLEAQLEREAGEGHPLRAGTATAIARREDTDDVLFALPDGPVRFAVVRLGQSDEGAHDSRELRFDSYDTLSDWRRDRKAPAPRGR